MADASSTAPSTEVLAFLLNTFYVSRRFELFCQMLRLSTVEMTKFDGVLKRVRMCDIHFNCLDSRDIEYLNLYVTSDIDEPSRTYYKTIRKEDRKKLADTGDKYAQYVKAMLNALQSEPLHQVPWVCNASIEDIHKLTPSDLIFITTVRSAKLSNILWLKYG